MEVLLARDSRYVVEEWLREHARPPALVAALGPLEFPFLDVATFRSEDPARVHSNLDKVGPEILVYVREHHALIREPGGCVLCSPKIRWCTATSAVRGADGFNPSARPSR